MTAQRFLKYFVLAVIAANLVIIAVVLFGFGHRSPPVVLLPKPNGYDDFQKAAQLVTGISILDLNRTNTADELRAFVSTNADALRLLRSGLDHECRVPIEYSTNFAETHAVLLPSLKALALVLEAEGRLAEIEHRTNDAAKSYLEVVRFGHAFSSGGLLIDHLVGLACESMGARDLKRVSGSMDANVSRQTIRELTGLEAKGEPVANIAARDRRWCSHVFGFHFREWLSGVILSRSLDAFKRSRESVELRTRNIQKQTLLAEIDLAARAYTLEKGVPPKTIADLVPGYLETIPKDPLTGTNLVYTAEK